MPSYQKAINNNEKTFKFAADYFGKGKYGDKDRPSEEEAEEEFTKRLSGLGIEVDEAGFLINKIKLTTESGEENIPLGVFESFWTVSDESNQDKANRLNSFIEEYGLQLQNEDEYFDYNTANLSHPIHSSNDTRPPALYIFHITLG